MWEEKDLPPTEKDEPEEIIDEKEYKINLIPDGTHKEYEDVDSTYDRAEKILRIKDALLQYRQDTHLPLCDGLTSNLMFEFVDWFQEEYLKY